MAALRRHAYSRSPFYRRHHAGLANAPLDQLPPVTKGDLMAHWDEVMTEPALRLSEVERHLGLLTRGQGDPGVPWQGRWWAAATAGSTGRRGVFIWGRREWASVLASYARASDWAGVSAGVAKPLRMAVVSSRNPAHQSAVVGASLASPLVPTLRLDATSPLQQQIRELNDFRPRLLVGYASALRPLATAQLTGALRISPQAVMSASEVLTRSASRSLRRRGAQCRTTSMPRPRQRGLPHRAPSAPDTCTRTCSSSSRSMMRGDRWRQAPQARGCG